MGTPNHVKIKWLLCISKKKKAPLYKPIYASVVAVCSPKITLGNYLGYFNQVTMKGSTVLKLPRRAVPACWPSSSLFGN